MDKRQIIGSNLLFEGLPTEQLEDINSIAVEKSYQRGQNIFFEGDTANGFYMVGEGKVKIYKVSPAGKEHILHIFGAGEPFGEVPVFHGQPFPATAEALSKTKTLFFPPQQIYSAGGIQSFYRIKHVGSTFTSSQKVCKSNRKPVIKRSAGSPCELSDISQRRAEWGRRYSSRYFQGSTCQPAWYHSRNAFENIFKNE